MSWCAVLWFGVIMSITLFTLVACRLAYRRSAHSIACLIYLLTPFYWNKNSESHHGIRITDGAIVLAAKVLTYRVHALLSYVLKYTYIHTHTHTYTHRST